MADFKKPFSKSSVLCADSLGISFRSELVFFTQYERELDKFKPSRSAFVIGMYRQAWYEQANDEDELRAVEDWYDDGLEATLKFMHKHPIKAYVYSMLTIQDVVEEISGIKCLRVYVYDWLYYIKHKFIKYIKLKHTSHKAIKMLKHISSCYDGAVLIRSDNWSPRVYVLLQRKDGADIEIAKEMEKYIDDVEDKYWNDIDIRELDYAIDAPLTEDEKVKQSTQFVVDFNKALEQWKYDEEATMVWCNCLDRLIN